MVKRKKRLMRISSCFLFAIGEIHCFAMKLCQILVIAYKKVDLINSYSLLVIRRCCACRA